MNEKHLSNLSKLKNKIPHVLGHKHFNTFSILLPLIKVNDEIHIVFETRALDLRRQPGEICFPGGRIDKEDNNSKSAAIREACEELRVKKEEIRLIGPLDFFVSPYETIIYPFVGWIEKELVDISPNPSEVEELFSIPLSYLIQIEPAIYNVSFQVQPEKSFPYHLIPDGKNYNWRERKMKEYFYFYDNKVIWGLTARILHEFLENLK